MRIKVIDVGTIEKVPTPKGFYLSCEIAHSVNGKIIGKKIVDWKYPAVFKTLTAAKSGEYFDIEVGEDGKYRPWINATRVDGVVAEAAAQSEAASTGSASSVGGQRTTGRVTGSSYETPEERATRQKLIVRQSSLTNAITLLIHNNPKGPVDQKAVISLADYFYGYVFQESLADMENDIPL